MTSIVLTAGALTLGAAAAQAAETSAGGTSSGVAMALATLGALPALVGARNWRRR
ncbi:MAG: hypothetical protein ACRDPC_02605 [Solirubrobacteraceae bacterium]